MGDQPMSSHPENEEWFSLREYLMALRIRKWTVLGVTAAALALAVGVSFVQPRHYTATARVLVKPSTNTPPGVPPNMVPEQALAQSTAVARIAAKQLKTSESPPTLTHHVSASAPTNTQTLLISYT